MFSQLHEPAVSELEAGGKFQTIYWEDFCVTISEFGVLRGTKGTKGTESCGSRLLSIKPSRQDADSVFMLVVTRLSAFQIP